MVNKIDNHEIEDTNEITNEHEADNILESDIDETDGRLEDKIKKIRSELKEANEAKRTALESLQRERADLLNTKKRLEEQARIDRERVLTKHIEELLPLCDSFDMAMQDPAWQAADPSWRKGVEGIYAQLVTILNNYGVDIMAPIGEPFNPHEHEALIDNGGDQKVTAVIQKGYRRAQTIIRPARVAVG
jgi:molecular chaperone GrpE